MNTKPLAKTSEILVQEFETELLVYDLKINKAFLLNETSAFIWQMCDGKTEVIEISKALSRQSSSPPAKIWFGWRLTD